MKKKMLGVCCLWYFTWGLIGILVFDNIGVGCGIGLILSYACGLSSNKKD